ncbi:hypothetical protein SLEP1_g6051 [Rubroshorea leprosula]|uniref:Uncharacterized protein n=1 Tax=Rubroshorea leprosula TaxID=152421 RepID=A0AAV5I4K1_9ROSI|nr:hypothetical protein SLEP1_g6051 [Rubroshorea leprosula]
MSTRECYLQKSYVGRSSKMMDDMKATLRELHGV